MARAGAATERAAGSLVYPHNADAGAEKDPREKGTESSHSAAATEVKFEDKDAETGPEVEEARSADDASDSAEAVSLEFHRE